MHSRLDMIDIESLLVRLEAGTADYAAALPYPHIVLDDALPADVFSAAVAEFPAADDPTWIGYLHVNETKFANPHASTWGETLQGLASAFCTDEFVKTLSKLTGFEHLVADPTMDGGGLHQTLRGGHLNVHADFTTHHRHPELRRRVNVLLYLNVDWTPEWGGALELWDADVTTCVRSVEPKANRLLIFTTSDDAYHGHPDALTCPSGEARRSLALYYFTEEDRPARRATKYRARPGDGVKGAAIWADRQVLALYDRLKVRRGLTDGSATRSLERLHRLLGRTRRS